MMRSYKFRMYPTKAQKAELSEMLGTFCWLYNQALEERRDGWRNYGHSFTYFQQYAGLKFLRRRDERLKRYSATAEGRVILQLDRAFQAFFRRVKAGENPGYPRFRSADRFDCAQFDVGDGFSLKGGRATFKGVEGGIRVKIHRDMPAAPKSVALKREGVRWFLICHVNVGQAAPSERLYSPVGIDVGLTSLVVMTTGESVPTPQWTARAAKRIRKHSRAMARAKAGSRRRAKAKGRLAEAHRRAANQRRDFLHKLSRRIVDAHSHIAIEDLSVSEMTRSHFGKSIHNAAWATLRTMIEQKAEEAAVQVIAVNPRGTTQNCSGCGVVVPKRLRDRQHDCPHCGLSLCRDLNAARNILSRANFRPGTGLRTPSQPVAA